MLEETMVSALTHYGLPGAVIAVFVALYILKDRELKQSREALKAESDARIADAKSFTTLALDVQKNVLTSVDKLHDVSEAIKNQYHSRGIG
jgi:hypothetical protein